MVRSYVIGIIGVVSLMTLWIAIQFTWRKIFSDHVTDEDAMAERTTCGNCGCTTSCKNKVTNNKTN